MFKSIIYSAQRILGVIFIAFIKAYRLFVSPFLRNRCRFYPSCSSYAQAAIREHGAIRGLYFTLGRLLRCHPFHSGGYDPIPNKEKRQ